MYEKEIVETPVDETVKQEETVADTEEVDEAAAEQAEDSEESANSDGDDTAAPPRKNRGVGKRINELVREREEARREAERLREEVEALKVQRGEPTEAEPTREQFDYDEEKYLRALAKYEAKQLLQAEREREIQEKERQAAEQAVTAFRSRVAEFEAEHPDFKDVAISNPLNVIFPDALVEAIRDLDDGPALHYHLGKDLSECKLVIQIASQAPSKSAAKKAVADYWKRVKPQAVAPPAKKTTSAPKPPPTVNANSPVQKNPAQMTWEEYKAYRAQQEANRRR